MGVSEGHSSKEKKSTDYTDRNSGICCGLCCCGDHYCAVVFALAFLTTLIAAILYGEEGFDKVCHYFILVGSYTVELIDVSVSKDLFMALVTLAAIAFVPALFWTISIMYFGNCMMSCGLSITAAGCGVSGFGLSFWMYEQGMGLYTFIWPTIGGCLICLGIFIFLCCMQWRISFAASNLSAACLALRSQWPLFFITLIMTAISAAWVLTWLVAAVGVIEYFEWNEFEEFLLVLFFLLMFFWGILVIKNIMLVTTASAIGGWYGIQGVDNIGTLCAWCKAMTVHLGSIAMGSFFVAALEAIKWTLIMFRFLLGGKDGWLSKKLCCVKYMVDCLVCALVVIVGFMKYLNTYAYVYIGMHQCRTFHEASRRAISELLGGQFTEIIINDMMIWAILTIGKLFCASITCVIGVVMSGGEWAEDIENVKVVMGIAGFLLGFTIASVIMSLIDSAVKTIYVCWVLYPNRLRDKKERRKVFQDLMMSYEVHHPKFAREQKKYLERADFGKPFKERGEETDQDV